MKTSESMDKIAKALVEVMGEIPAPRKVKTNPAFKSKYAGLDDVMDAIRPVLMKHKLFITQPTRFEAGATTLVTRIMHESGQWIEGEYPIEPAQNTPQGMGSALTYARRYAVCAILGIVADEDDDGNAASATPAPNKAQQARDEVVAKAKSSLSPDQESAAKWLKGLGIDPEGYKAFKAKFPDTWATVALAMRTAGVATLEQFNEKTKEAA